MLMPTRTNRAALFGHTKPYDMDIFLTYWAEILLGLITFLDIVVSLTPSKKDDQILGYFRIIIQALSGRGKKR